MEKFRVVEWTIDNFSCWKGDIHDKVITSPTSPYAYGTTFYLFPRGLSGHEQHLVVHIIFKATPVYSGSGELSFIGSDGSHLYQQQVDLNGGSDVIEFPFGPRFEEVVAQIRKNEDVHNGDRLILRFMLKIKHVYDSIENMHTTIDAFDASIKITPNTLEILNLENHYILALSYFTKKDEVSQMSLEASENQIDTSKIALTLQRDCGGKKKFVITRMFVLNNKNVVRKEENEHLFRANPENWTFSNSLTRDEITNKGLTIILSIKIIPDNSYTHSVGLKLYKTDAVYPIKLSKFKPAGTSAFKEYFSKNRLGVSSNQENSSVGVLTKELMCLYQDQDFSDLQLKCGNVSFSVHKNILSARSPVFKTMLSTDMAEAASGQVVIEDLDPSTLALFLSFLYTGAVEDLQSDGALKLYYAADKYQVPSLKLECVAMLGSSVSFSNVFDILSLADKHHDDLLVSSAHDFILENYNEVLRSPEWNSFMKSEPLLALETLTHFAHKNLVKKS